MSENKVLVTSKDLASMGGVANYYRLFFKHFDDDGWSLEHIAIGSRSKRYYKKRKKLEYLGQYLSDLHRLVGMLAGDETIRIVQLNPSMIPLPVVRDGLMLLVAKAMRRKTVFFFRGWDSTFVTTSRVRGLMERSVAWLCNRSDAIVVLSNDFREELLDWGVSNSKIRVSRTTYDGDLVPNRRERSDEPPRFLFLGRIAKDKGVFEIVRAASTLRKEGLEFYLTIVGFAREPETIDELKRLAAAGGIENITTFKGFLDGEDKYSEYASSDVFLLPTYHPEGCPNSVLEAMASGLYIICTDIGALKEVVRDGENGSIVRPRDEGDLTDKMRGAINAIERVRRIGALNLDYAASNFEARCITRQFIELYNELASS